MADVLTEVGDVLFSKGSSDDGIERTPEANDLLHRLKEQVHKGVLFGHQDSTAYGVEWEQGEEERSDVKDVSGKWPAVYGWDVGGIEKGGDTNIDNVSFQLIRDRIKNAHNRNGINTLSFHQSHPLTGDSAFDNTEAAEEILPPKDSDTESFISAIDKMADFLLSLKDDNDTLIPVVLRLYHEHNQEWAWWGCKVCSTDQYKELFRMAVKRIREKGAKHVLFCYSPQDVTDREEYMSGYPGDEYVDVFGLDFYTVCDKDQMEWLSNALDMIVDIADEKNKVAALTETGIQNVPISDWWSEYLLPVLRREKCSRIAWVLFWRNFGKDHFFVPFKGHESEQDFIKFQQSPIMEFGGSD